MWIRCIYPVFIQVKYIFSGSSLKALYTTRFILVLASNSKIPVIIDNKLLYVNYAIGSKVAYLLYL